VANLKNENSESRSQNKENYCDALAKEIKAYVKLVSLVVYME